MASCFKSREITNTNQRIRGKSNKGSLNSSSSGLRTSIFAGRNLGTIRHIMSRTSLATMLANPNKTGKQAIISSMTEGTLIMSRDRTRGLSTRV